MIDECKDCPYRHCPEKCAECPKNFKCEPGNLFK